MRPRWTLARELCRPLAAAAELDTLSVASRGCFTIHSFTDARHYGEANVTRLLVLGFRINQIPVLTFRL